MCFVFAYHKSGFLYFLVKGRVVFHHILHIPSLTVSPIRLVPFHCQPPGSKLRKVAALQPSAGRRLHFQTPFRHPRAGPCSERECPVPPPHPPPPPSPGPERSGDRTEPSPLLPQLLRDPTAGIAQSRRRIHWRPALPGCVGQGVARWDGARPCVGGARPCVGGARSSVGGAQADRRSRGAGSSPLLRRRWRPKPFRVGAEAGRGRHGSCYCSSGLGWALSLPAPRLSVCPDSSPLFTLGC